MAKYGKRPAVSDFDAQLKGLLGKSTIRYINDFNVANVTGRKEFNQILTHMYEDDVVSHEPACICKQTHGAEKVGRICKECGSEVMSPFHRPIINDVWARTPEGVDYFINPLSWRCLLSPFETKEGNLLLWQVDTRYRWPGEKTPQLEAWKERNVKRGYNYFCNNIVKIMDMMLDRRYVPKKTKNPDMASAREYVIRYHKKFLSHVIPIPNRVNYVIEKSSLGTYADVTMTGIRDALQTINSISNSPDVNHESNERAIVKTLNQLSDYYMAVLKALIDPKPGMTRKQVISARETFTFRDVITSNWDVHQRDELIIPWATSISVFRLHIINKLTKQGMPIRAQYDTLHTYQNTVTGRLYEILQEILAGNGEKFGFPADWNRNPTINRLSAQLMRIVAINTDTTVIAAQTPTTATAGPNADFDGDQMHGKLLLDEFTRKNYAYMAAHYGIAHPHKLNCVNPKTLKVPNETISTINNWVMSGHDYFGETIDEEQ